MFGLVGNHSITEMKCQGLPLDTLAGGCPIKCLAWHGNS